MCVTNSLNKTFTIKCFQYKIYGLVEDFADRALKFDIQMGSLV